MTWWCRLATDWRPCREIGSGSNSIRINEWWRVCFVWRDGEAWQVEMVDYH